MYILHSYHHHSISLYLIMSHNYHFLFVTRMFKTYSLSNFQVYNKALLTTITLSYIRCPEVIRLLHADLYPLTNISPFPNTTASSW